QYDSKKSGGVTISHLRFGDKPIRSPYYITKADFVGCHNPAYIEKYDMVQDVKPGGVFLLNCPWDVDELSKHMPAAAKKYIAENNIQLYTIDALKLARSFGLGNRTNSILQSAFFKLANILPIDDAVKYMKDAVEATYGRKGDKVVSMNQAAIDAGVENLVKVEIPASWSNPEPDAPVAKPEGARPELADYVHDILYPTVAMRGESLPVSAFLPTKNGILPAGTAAFEKRGIANDVPEWQPANCIQCNQCSIACPHAAIRPFALDPDEVANAPEGMKFIPMTGKGNEDRKFAIAVSVMDCTGCGSCASVCPAKQKALVMKPLDEQREEQKNFDYAVKNISFKDTGFAETTVKGSQFKQPLLEFSGACAGCGETPYAKLVTQLFGDRMYLANATGCSSIWGGSAPSTPYTVNKDGKGPAWSNSLFEDNAEFGLGMASAVKQRRAGVAQVVKSLIETDGCDAAIKEAGQNWLDKMDDSKESRPAGEKLTELCKAAANGSGAVAELAAKVVAGSDMLTKPSMWMFGGDGWAYDIGFGGLDHVLASGENVNVLVFDTEVYSNTGGQASKATPIGAVAQFAAAGKAVKKKELAQIAMSYGYIYVAQISLGASYQQAVKAIVEAESYDGPSLIVAYAPCINHGAKAGMAKAMDEAKRGVEAGYWNLLRYDPRLEKEGKNPLIIDSKAPSASYNDFIMGEDRYASLTLSFPERAKTLFGIAEKNSVERYEKLLRQQAMYENK
ncbi:MAG: pyruvate:ferredoxin (flavodoxin) oxidoreductase, partial [Oscillospiraceae bacterium]|nr:pyruvate:ferredoxin (flavodoxin) oxidoreductase [Oscillospiraceae bacterium]